MPPSRRPWWRADATADEPDKLASLPSDGARWAWFRMMCRAKTQRRMGAFAGRSHLKGLLGSYGRHIPDLIRVGVAHDWPTDCERCTADYSDASTGDVVVHDYRREQRDPTNADRQADYRSRNAESNDPVTETVTPTSRGRAHTLSPSPSLSPSPTNEEDGYQVATPPEAHDLRGLADELTGRHNSLANVWGGLGEMAVSLSRKHGYHVVEREWRRIAAEEGGMPTIRQLVLGADNALNRITSPTPITKADRAADLAEARERAEQRGRERRAQRENHDAA